MPALRDAGFADRACRWCGFRCFTLGGRRHHELACDDRPGLTDDERAAVKAQVRAATERAEAAELVRAKLACNECDLVSTGNGLTIHQRHSGHVGRTEVVA